MQTDAPKQTANGVSAHWTGKGLEALWLATVFFVPLIFIDTDSALSPYQTPKVALMRSLVGLMAALWIVGALLSGRQWKVDLGNPWGRFKQWTVAQPARLIVVAAVAFLSVNALSALGSASFSTSLWGKTPSVDGYSLYNMASYIVLFLTIAIHVRTKAQAQRLLGAIVMAGVVVGLVGIYQWAAAGAPGDIGSNRAISTIGNPVFVGAVLGLTIPVTLGLALSTARRDMWPVQLAVWAVLVGVQMFGLLLAFSRGPWIGLIAGLAVFAVLASIGFRVWRLRRVYLVGVAAAAVTLVIMGSVAWTRLNATDTVSIQAIGERGASILEAIESGTLGDRALVWRGSLDIITDRPAIPTATNGVYIQRFLLGYGPELFGAAFPLGTPQELGLPLSTHYEYAHNYLLHEAVELGILGLGIYLALLVAVFGVGLRLAGLGNSSTAPRGRWLAIALLAAVASRVIEEMTGIARVSDTTIFWALLGLLVALPQILSRSATPEDIKEPASRRARRRSKSRAAVDSTSAVSTLRVAFMVFAVIVIGTFSWLKNVNYVQATMLGAESVHALKNGQADEALRLADRAISLAPDVAEFRLQRGYIYDVSRDNVPGTDEQLRFGLLAYTAHADALNASPLSPTTNIAKANAGMALVRLGRNDLLRSSLDLYHVTQTLRPDAYEPYTILAGAYLQVGESQAALTAAEHALHPTNDSENDRETSARAHLLKAIAHFQLEQWDEADEAAHQSLEIWRLSDLEVQAARELIVDILKVRPPEEAEQPD